MRASALLICLAILSLASSVIILQSTTATVITSPPSTTTIIATSFNTAYPNLAGSGVSWITGSPFTTAPYVFRNLFYASCPGAAVLAISASTNFWAYLDGVLIGTGSGPAALSKFTIKLTCGNHNLTIQVTGQKKALTFAIEQDQSACTCASTGFWDEGTCSCQCINSQYSTGCDCIKPKVWKPYPTCACGCPPQIIIYNPTVSGIVSLRSNADAGDVAPPADNGEDNQPAERAAEGAVRPTAVESYIQYGGKYCFPPRYYSQDNCMCVCHYKYCDPGYYFDQIACICFPYLK